MSMDLRIEQIKRVLALLHGADSPRLGLWRFDVACKMLDRGANAEAECAKQGMASCHWFALAVDLLRKNPKAGRYDWNRYSEEERLAVAESFLPAARSLLLWYDAREDAPDREGYDIFYGDESPEAVIHTYLENVELNAGGLMVLLFKANRFGSMGFNSEFFDALAKGFVVNPNAVEATQTSDPGEVQELESVMEAIQEEEASTDQDNGDVHPELRERYREVTQKTMCWCRMLPCAYRFNSICETISEGVDIALRGEADFEFYNQAWFGVCLDLLTEIPNSDPAHEPTIADPIALFASFKPMMDSLLHVLEIYQQQHPKVDPSEWDEFYRVIYNRILLPNTTIDEESQTRSTNIDQKLIFCLDGTNHLVYVKSIYQALRAACHTEDRVSVFRGAPIPQADRDFINRVNLAARGDADENCRGDYFVQKDFADKTSKYCRGFIDDERNPLRYTRLQDGAALGEILLHFIGEYCYPFTRYLSKVAPDILAEGSPRTCFDQSVTEIDRFLEEVVKASRFGESATAAINLWREVRTTIVDRLNNFTITPTIDSQERIRWRILKLRVLIIEAAQEVKAAGVTPNNGNGASKTNMTRGITVSQAMRHKRVCDEIALELELWRCSKYAEFGQANGKNTICEPSVDELMRRINQRHSSDKDWKPLNKNKVLRHLEAAIGYKINEAKKISSHYGKQDIAASTERGETIRKRFADNGRADICLYWAALSNASIEFAKEMKPEIDKTARALGTDLSYRRALQVVAAKWPH